MTFVREEVQTVNVVKIRAANCKQIRKQLELLQKIYETVPCGIVQYTNDDECKIINANQAACNIHEGVKKVSDIVAEFLRNIGFLTRTINFPNAGNMLVAEYGDMTKPFVIITGHMDTVFNKGAASTRAFKIEDGKAYGPGVLDMKGGITIALFVLKALLSMNYRKHPIKIILAGDEEIGHSCSTAPQEFIKEGTGAFAAFNMHWGISGPSRRSLKQEKSTIAIV